MIDTHHFEKALTGNPAISGDLAHSAGKTEANPVNGIAAGEKTFSPAIHERKGHTPGEWIAFDSAPQDGTTFLALNHDGEIWVAKFTDDRRLLFRNNHRRESRTFRIHNIGGLKLLEEDEEYARANERWASDWTFWTRLYKFKPTHWFPLPAAITKAEG